jgi:hypothetical protein
MNISFFAFQKAAQNFVLNSIAGIPYVSRKDGSLNNEGRQFPVSDLVSEAEEERLAQRERDTRIYLDALAEEVKNRHK